MAEGETLLGKEAGSPHCVCLPAVAGADQPSAEPGDSLAPALFFDLYGLCCGLGTSDLGDTAALSVPKPL